VVRVDRINPATARGTLVRSTIIAGLLLVMNYIPNPPFSLLPPDAYSAFADETPSVPTTPQPELASIDQNFLRSAARDNWSAITVLRQLVSHVGDNSLHRYARAALGERMASQQELEVLAIRKNVLLPTRRQLDHNPLRREHSERSGQALDRAVVSRCAGQAKKAALYFTTVSHRVRDTEVKAFAIAQTLILEQDAAAALAAISSCACNGLPAPHTR